MANCFAVKSLLAILFFCLSIQAAGIILESCVPKFMEYETDSERVLGGLKNVVSFKCEPEINGT